MKEKNKSDQNQKFELMDDSVIENYKEGKDELNFAEFPLSLISTKNNNNIKTLEFSDSVYDKYEKKSIKRKLTITASDKYGLPNSLDNDVIVGLIQLSKIQGFKNRTVKFSRYQLIKLLGWNSDGYHYKKIKDSLKKWKGVNLYYKNAWRDPIRKNWITQMFSLIDNIEMNDPKDVYSPEFCSISWNEIVFKSFQNGNVKNISYWFYNQLKLPTSKRLFRYLDKSFHRNKFQQFDLTDFAFNKIGLSQNYDTGQIKQRLSNAIKELEDKNFIKKITRKERYKKIMKGKWKVFFERGSFEDKNLMDSEKDIELKIQTKPVKSSELRAISKKFNPQSSNNINDDKQKLILKKLTTKKISSKKAKELIEKYEYEFLDEKIEVLDLMKEKNFRLGNQAGYLIKSIEEDWQASDIIKTSYQKKREQAQRKELEVTRQLKKSQREKLEEDRRNDEQKQWEDDFRLVEKYLQSLPKKQREALIADLVANSDKMTRDFINKYLADKTKPGFGKACYEGLLMENLLDLAKKKFK